MVIDEDIYIEHFGVKGQKWGVRKKRERSSEEQAARKQKIKKIAIGAGAAALVGGAIAGTILLKRGSTKTSDLSSLSSLRGKLKVDESAVKAILNRSANQKVSNLKPPPKVKGQLSPKAAADIRKMTIDWNAQIREGNAYLKDMYNKNQTPFGQREYIQEHLVS